MKERKAHRRRSHKERDDLTGEHLWGDGGQLVLMVIFGITWVADSLVLHFSDQPAQLVHFYLRLFIALVLFLVSGWLARDGLRIVFGEVRKKPHVITKGVFGIVRHPIYLGSILLYAGFIALTLSLASFAIWLVIVAFYYVLSQYEERLLTERFGKEYEDYMKKVPMLIPGLGGR
jgi:protein-S-isoprenylcysteine O-methyltransferase Ste14